MSQKTVFITGGAGGLGGASSRHLAERGWRVFAADLDDAALARIDEVPGVTALRVDVSDTRSIEAAGAAVQQAVGGLDGIVNFAGILAVGSLVELEEAALARVLDVNVMGTFRVNRTLLPLVLNRSGRIVNISSETGWQSGMPFNGAYAMSKHAIECYSDALRRELVFLDVPVIKIQPGPFRTEMVTSIERSFARAAESSRYFGAMLKRLGKLTVKEQQKANDPAVVAYAVHTALTTSSPRAAYSVKPDLQRVALHYLPERVADRLLQVAMRG